MYIKKIYLLILLSILIFLTGCTITHKSGSEIGQLDDMTFYDTVPDGYAAKGYYEWTETDNAIYYFSYGNDEEKTQLVRKAETIIQMAVKQYQMQPMVPSEKITVSFRQDSVKYYGNGPSIGVEINPQDRNQAGVLTYFISGGQLPAWLCIGLEQYWLDGNGICDLVIDREIDAAEWYQSAMHKGLPALGDEWLIPGLISDELSDDIQSVAYAFVRYLDDNNQLSKIIKTYPENQTQWEAELIRNSLWSEFTNTEPQEEMEFIFYYLMNQYVYPSFQKNILFWIKGAQGNYYYSEADWWTIEKAKEYAYAGEDSIKYVKDWFSVQNDEVLYVHYIVADGTPVISGQFVEGTHIHAHIGEQSKPLGVAHEVVHVMLNLCKLYTNGFDENGYYNDISRRCFQEGLCEYINYMFLMETNNQVIIDAASEYLPSFIKVRLGEDYLEKYLLKLDEGNDKNLVNAMAMADLIGIKDIEENDVKNKVNATGEKKQYLFHSGAVISFICYLFEVNQSKEGFLEVYKDAINLEEVYGKNLNSLIDDWLAHLNNTYMVAE